MTMLEKIQIMLDKPLEPKLQIILDMCKRKVLRYISYTEQEMTEEIEDIIIEFTILRWNKLGSEGLQSESFSDVNNNFSNDIPYDLKMQLNKFRRLRTL